jgi:hypothetical protein
VALTENGKLNLNEPIAVGQHRTIALELQNNQHWNPNQQYSFRISTLRGSNFDITYKSTQNVG